MSIKRQATTELNHDNWDQEDATEPEEMGTFKTASKEVLEKRVIRTAKRRSQISSAEPNKSVFSGFGGFNKVQPSSFDFLANLTNGNKSTNGQSTTKIDTPISSSIFTSKTFSSSPSPGLFSMSGSTGFAAKPTVTKSPEGTLFGISTANNNTSPIQSVFTSPKADSTVKDSPFKLQSSPSTVGTENKINPDVTTSVKFGMPSSSSVNKSLFSSTNDKPTLLSTQPVTNPPTPATSSTISTSTECNNADSNSESNSNMDKKQRYYSKIKALNESVSEWIKKHVDETPVCILSPIFRDYEKYIKEIKDEYYGDEKDSENNQNMNETKLPSSEEKKLPASNSTISIFGNLKASSSAKTEASQNNSSGIGAKAFNFGINTTTSTTSSTTASTGFSFGIKSPISSTTSSPFSITTTTTTSTPFSFGINKTGFNLNATTPPKTDATPENKEEEDEPPKVEFTPIVEENSVFDIKCKIFIKKDGNFVDKGVGTLYIKKIEESGKHQLLVRANTNLGTVLLNLVLSSAIPTQRMGKNNVMIVCIPTTDAKPPPTPILIRVKTSQDADELLNTLDKYKS